MQQRYIVGAGAGFSADRIDAAVELVKSGVMYALSIEVLAERTLALQHIEKSKGGLGYWPHLEKYTKQLFPLCLEKNIKIISNLGGADPCSATTTIKQLLRGSNYGKRSIATITGDNLQEEISTLNPVLFETHQPLELLQQPIIAAHAYIGAEGIREGLNHKADIVIGGRLSDSALALGACFDNLGWDNHDWDRIAAGVMAGHLSECAAQVTGGYFADPPLKPVPHLERIGFPLVHIYQDGTLFITKPEGSGGHITRQTVLEQLLYEIHNPACYITPDVIVDLTETVVEEAKNGVLIKGIKGKPAPTTLKTLITVENGILVEGGISYAGINCDRRAQLAKEILTNRFKKIGLKENEFLINFIGINSSHLLNQRIDSPQEMRLHIAARTWTNTLSQDLQAEIEAMYTNGPAGGGGIRVNAKNSLKVYSCLVPRDIVSIQTTTEIISGE